MKITNLIITALVLVSSNVALATACKSKNTISMFGNSNPTSVVQAGTTATGSAVK